MVGVGTVLADNPELTCRIPGFRADPVVRVVVDSHLRTSLTSRLAATAAETPDLDPDPRRAPTPPADDAFVDLGVTLIEVPGSDAGRRSAAAPARRWARPA